MTVVGKVHQVYKVRRDDVDLMAPGLSLHPVQDGRKIPMQENIGARENRELCLEKEITHFC